ncbi:lysophospholipid acyltransferase family protein [Tomitella fengzijianii]|uniref:Acyltransferase family protein n=1 Tax=Tomitella fengzijianii TaxID=2597660 RepID=A0A516X3F1_9ACTN|nr:lysophospholipid acyltransferase family protein [Tomitella fengzijianii]QDQ97543.1 acyltransferase family protein [Tomitella fengzijianii]
MAEWASLLGEPVAAVRRALTPGPGGLEGRDPEFIREMLPRFWLAARLYFRAEVNGFDNVPDEPVLFVGNHSGGADIPDTFVFLLGYHTYFTVEGRPLVGLAHKIVTRMPVVGDFARKFGMVQADMDTAAELLRGGANVLVYPGGDVEALRPWRDRNRIVFDGRKGFLRLAHANGVKIVPVVATGGQETFYVFNDGRKTAKLLRFDKLLRVKSVPVSLSVPWGLLPADLPHIPLPAKIRIQVLEPIDLQERFGDDPDWDEAYEYVTSVMQVALSRLATKSVIPVVS